MKTRSFVGLIIVAAMVAVCSCGGGTTVKTPPSPTPAPTAAVGDGSQKNAISEATDSVGRADTIEIVSDDEVIRLYWSYGKKHTLLDIGDDGVATGVPDDSLNIHVLTKPGNDGKIVKLTLGDYDGTEFNVSAIVKNDLAVVENVYDLKVMKTPWVVNHGSFTDMRDGKTYSTVVMPGGKTWMAENLNYDTANGSGSWCYNNSPDSCAKYGRLYDWNTAVAVCPAGWRLPDTSDWGTFDERAVRGRSTAGTKLKSQSGWHRGDDGNDGNGTDEYGFSAMPGGRRRGADGTFNHVGYDSYWWTATKIYVDSASEGRALYNRYGNAHSTWGYDNDGFSVRCIRDD